MLEYAQHSAELSETVDNIASNHMSNVSGLLRLSSPPGISDSLLAPLVGAFQATYPNVRVQIFVTERSLDPISEGIDLGFRVGTLKDSALVVRKILTYRHQLLASPAYLEKCKQPETPQDLLEHRLLAFSRWKRESSWGFAHANGNDKGNADVSALSRDERLHRSRARIARGRRHRRTSAGGAARTSARRTAR